MASTYVNDLRLNEMATGDASGTWGTVTNTNLELIGEALGYGTEGITTNANTHTTTVADGATDPGRAMYIEYTGTLDSACTITIAPNTLNRMHFIENGTSGSQNIIIKQGSGATITIPPGDVKAVYLDGAGSGAAVVDAFASLSVVDLKVQDDLTVTDDMTVGGTLGVTGVLTATSLDISGDIDVDGTTNLDVVDIDGAVDMATTALVTGVLTTTAATVFNGGFASNAASTISTADNLDTLSLVSTDADADVAPNLRMYRNSGSPADSDQLGKIQFEGRNDNSQDVIYSEIINQIKDASDGTESGRIALNSMVAGTLRARLDILPTETILNAGTIDLDFRVVSDNLTHALFVQGSDGNVGIGNSTPSSYSSSSDNLVVGTSGDTGITVVSGTASNGQLKFADGTSGDATGRGIIDYNHVTDSMAFKTAATERMRINASGNISLACTSDYKTLTVGDTDAKAWITSGGSNTHLTLSANGTSGAVILRTGGTNGDPSTTTEKMRITPAGKLLLGTTSSVSIGGGAVDENAIEFGPGFININRDDTANNRLLQFGGNGVTIGSIDATSTGGGSIIIGNDDSGIMFRGDLTGSAFIPADPSTGNQVDNSLDVGHNAVRFQDIYATNGTIQTSDRNEKQDIEALTDAETRVAVAAKGLLRKYRWKSAVAKKGNEARTHFGIIAQDLQDAFTAEGLDAGDYAMFISTTWTDDDGEEQTRLGVRYSQLLAFIIAAI